ncbi:hypothetical protein DTO96_100170 [Ephemeroptericola cinctiostellae]|uniref:Uncharacterized protein n=1 Tax=Ephemeroptericola cinctiostellae TaxID=2268024 RepID=A0A345D7X4_9BURK|nr:hypothetical protein [Ephemeroptericola cinctiostellae]AXF84462.1 hypothetical protein DTO96_100170 [Ephemeroptericola cinctiostellae]
MMASLQLVKKASIESTTRLAVVHAPELTIQLYSREYGVLMWTIEGKTASEAEENSKSV